MKLDIFCIAHCVVLLTIIESKKDNTTIIIPPDDDNPPCIFCDTTISKLEILWQQSLQKDTLESISTEPVIINDKVVFTLWPENPSDPELVTAYSLETGATQWQWESISTSHTNVNNSLFSHNENILYKASSKEVCLLDGNTSDLIWSYSPYDHGLRGSNMKIMGDYYYQGHNPPETVKQSSTLVRGNMETGEIENLITKEIQEGFSPSLRSSSIWVDENNEDHLLIMNNGYNWNTNEVKGDLILFNLNTKEEVYVWEDILGGGSANISYVWNNNIYLHANESMMCINLISKDIIWQSYIGGTNSCNFFVEKGVLIANPIDRNLFGFNPHTGETIWHETDSGSTCSNMTYFDGIVYFGSLGRGLLYAVDIETGEHIWAEKSPNKDKFSSSAFVNGVAIDTINRVLYTDDEYFVMAIKLPER